MAEDNNCPKPACGQPESTHRYSAGKRLSICGNGHSWDAKEIADQRAKAKEAEGGEFKFIVDGPAARPEYMERVKRRILNDFPYLR